MLCPLISDRDWALVCLFALHFIWNERCTLGLLGHHAFKCAIGGPRTKDHAPLSCTHDKRLGWCIHCLNCIAMLCLALCCCQLQVLQAFLAGRQYLVPTGNVLVADSLISSRWPYLAAGGYSTQPVVSPNVQRGIPEALEVFGGAEQGKQRQTMHGSAIPSRTRACVASGSPPEAVYCFS